jgi:hypothetical protein
MRWDHQEPVTSLSDSAPSPSVHNPMKSVCKRRWGRKGETRKTEWGKGVCWIGGCGTKRPFEGALNPSPDGGVPHCDCVAELISRLGRCKKLRLSLSLFLLFAVDFRNGSGVGERDNRRKCNGRRLGSPREIDLSLWAGCCLSQSVAGEVKFIWKTGKLHARKGKDNLENDA